MSRKHNGRDTGVLGRGVPETLERSEGAESQFATRQRANDFIRLMRTLPDPDPILRKMGRGITALHELLTDSHLESVWSVRCSAASGAEWFCAAGGEGGREKRRRKRSRRNWGLLTCRASWKR